MSAVTYVSNSNVFLSGSPASFNFTTSTNYGRVLFFSAGIMDDRESRRITSVTYGSQNFTFLRRDVSGSGNGSGMASEIWYLLNPNSGTNAVVVRQGTASRKVMGVVEYRGVTSVGSSNSVAGDVSSLVLTLQTTSPRSVIAGFFAQKLDFWSGLFGVSFSTGSGMTSRWNRQGYYNLEFIRGMEWDRTTVSSGYYNVTCTSNRTGYSALSAVELKPSAPSVSSVVPAVGYTGGGNSVTITGANFDNGCSVSFGGAAAASVTYINSGTLRVITPPHSAGTVDVTVTNLDGQSAVGAGLFTYSIYQTPSLSSVSPVSGTSLGGTYVLISGSNFVNGCSVTFGGLPVQGLNFISSSSLGVTTPANSAGAVDVVVTNPDNQSASLPQGYTYIRPAPEVLSCEPASGLTSGGQQITVRGKYFIAGCSASFDGLPASVTFIDSSTLTAITPSHAAGAVNVRVTNPDSQYGVLTGGFTYFVNSPPQVMSVSPASGPTTGGQSITVTGTGFASGCTALIGANAAAVTYIDSTTIALLTPARAAGTVDIRVTNPDTQYAVLPASYTYAVPPSILAVSPPSGKTTGGQTITVSGVNFRAGCAVFLDSLPCAVTRVSSAQLLLTTPPHSQSYVDVRVDNTDFTSGTLVSGFYYDGTAPVISLNTGGSSVTVAAGTAYVEYATAADDFDGDITSRIARVITDSLGATKPSVSTALPGFYTITYDVSDTAQNAALRQTRTVFVTDQTPPVISLNGGGPSVYITVGDTYIEQATASDNVDGNITSSIARVVRDSLNNVVPDVSTAAAETYTITYDVQDSAGNSATQVTRVVHVIGLAITAITITNPADKLVYGVGEALDLSGLVVTAVFEDSSTALLSVNQLHISGFDSSNTVNAQAITVEYSGQTDVYYVDIVAVTSIAVTAPPLKTVYDIGEPLDLTGLQVTATYSNGSSAVVAVTGSDISGFSSASAVNNLELTVTYSGKTANFYVDIVPTLASIAVTAEPFKKVYDIGESLDITGLVVTGTYTDGSTRIETIMPADVTGLDTSAAAVGQVLTVTYGGKTAYYTVDVVPTLVSIAITKPANKVVFRVGQLLDISGLEVTGTYTDGNTAIEAVSLSDVSGFDSSVSVTGQLLTINIKGRTTTYTVDIIQPELISIAVTSQPLKQVYSLYEALDITGLVVTGTYDDMSTQVLPVNESNISGFDSTTPASPLTLTVTYMGKNAFFDVSVLANPPIVDSCEPETGDSAGGTSVTIYGDKFVAGCTVTFDGHPATNVTVVDEFTITANTPACAAGIVNVVVTNPDGLSGTGYGIFTYTGATATPSRSATQTVTPTITVTRTNTPYYSPTVTPTITVTFTHTSTRTVTPTVTATPTFTITLTHTTSPTSTDTPTITPTFTATPTVTVTSTPTFRPVEHGGTYVCPQPAYDTVNFIFGSNVAGDAVIHIFNAAGIPVAELSGTAEVSAANRITLDLKGFAPGVYYYIVRVKGMNFKANKFLVAK